MCARLWLLGLILVLEACSATQSSLQPATPPAGTSSASPTAETSAGPSSEPLTAVPRSSYVPAEGVTIVYDGGAQFELWSPAGQRVLIDVFGSFALAPPPVTSSDVLLTTHDHSDHYLADFVDGFPGRTLTFEPGRLSASDVEVTSVVTRHGGIGGDNYVFVIDVGGLRVAHFGDLGQDELTSEQLAAIGQVDVAISQLANQYSDMSADNRMALHQMRQVRPRLLIPTAHVDVAAARTFMPDWSVGCAGRWVTVTPDQLPAQAMLFMGDAGPEYQRLLQLARCSSSGALPGLDG